MSGKLETAGARAAAPSIPGPKGLPLVGVGPRLIRDPLTFFARAVERYGEVVNLDLGSARMVLVVHPDAVGRVILDHVRGYEKNYEFLVGLLGNGIVSSNGSFWLRQRRLMQPAFHHRRIAAFATVMAAEAERMAERWEPLARAGRAVEVGAAMVELAQRITLRTMFSAEIGTQAERVGRAFDEILNFVNDSQYQAVRLPLDWPTPANRRFRANLDFLDGLVYGLIDQRRRSGEHGDDLLGLLLDAEDAETGERMSRQQIRDEVMTIYLAGHETSASMLAWLLYLIPSHPYVERRVRAELAEALGGRVPAMADLPRLPYLRMVVDEALRLFSPNWILTRRAVDDDMLGGYHIPAGTTIAPSPYVTHRLPAFWENPETFDPERFAPERAGERHRFAYIPFLSGPRQCIGSSFALAEIQIVLATLLQRFKLAEIMGYPVRPVARALLKPGPSVWMRLAPA